MRQLRALTAGLVGLALAGGASPSTDSGASRMEACGVRFTPDELTLSPRPVRVLAEVPDGSPGGLREVRPDPASGILVLEAERDRKAPVPTWVIKLDLRDAEAGRWEIELSGRRDDCAGPLVLREL